ncbi:MAG: nucleoside deaminase [Saprospiraceae bacterium]|nr:nucleoside deaminase [Saprospiraceae bacterium]MCZ2336674.1 nucleoside deaminase [Chitinophagales bacterium]
MNTNNTIPSDEHTLFMDRCINLARIAKANHKTPVGAVMVYQGNIVGEGIEGDQQFPSPIAHAEAIAIIRAIENLGTKDLSECTLYSTKEPCFMCAYLIRQYKVSQVFFAQTVEEIGGFTSDYPILTSKSITKWNPPPKVISGFYLDDCKKALG